MVKRFFDRLSGIEFLNIPVGKTVLLGGTILGGYLAGKWARSKGYNAALPSAGIVAATAALKPVRDFLGDVGSDAVAIGCGLNAGYYGLDLGPQIEKLVTKVAPVAAPAVVPPLVPEVPSGREVLAPGWERPGYPVGKPTPMPYAAVNPSVGSPGAPSGYAGARGLGQEYVSDVERKVSAILSRY